MKVQALERTGGFVVFDLDAATTSVGVVRSAPKVLRDGAELLARSVTYSFAVFGVEGHGGASAAVNTAPDDRDAAVAAFVEEVAPLVTERSLLVHAGTGVHAAELAPLGVAPLDPSLTAAGAVACADAVLGGLSGCRVALSGTGPAIDAARVVVGARNATVVADDDLAATDAVFVAGKAGVIDDEVAAVLDTRVVVPLTPVPVTARAFAVLRRKGVVMVPDFVSTAASVLDATGVASGDPVDQVRQLVSGLASEGPAMWLAAVGLAEVFLATWQDEKPFGRPLA